MNYGDMMQTMKFGYMPPSSIWKDPKNNKKFRVVGNMEWWVLHKTGKTEGLPERGEEQRLVKVYRKRQPPGGR